MKTKKSPVLYLLLWLFFAYLFISILSFNQAGISNPVLQVMYFIQFGIHEVAHLGLMFAPVVIVASEGSMAELLFTSVVAFVAFRAKAYFAGIFGLLWFMLAAKSAGNYMADARSQALPLIGPGQNIKHDWNAVFTELGLLSADQAIGGIVTWIGVIVAAIGMLFGLWLIIQYFTEPATPTTK
jgi:hypothetical protein